MQNLIFDLKRKKKILTKNNITIRCNGLFIILLNFISLYLLKCYTLYNIIDDNTKIIILIIPTTE